MWISKKKWKELVLELDALKVQCSIYKGRGEHYQKRYLDELQKRLELADRVRELESK